MQYKINYPYFGKTHDGAIFAILEPKYVISLEHQGTHGFGFAVYISRTKVLDFYKKSKEITKAEFQAAIRIKACNFINGMPDSEVIFLPIKQAKQIKGI